MHHRPLRLPCAANSGLVGEQAGVAVFGGMEAHALPSGRSDASPAVQEQQRRSPRFSPVAERAGFLQQRWHQTRGRGGGGLDRQSTTVQLGLWGHDYSEEAQSTCSTIFRWRLRPMGVPGGVRV
eukprot:6210022-Pleurochrysis_carterae.AAC.2